MNFETKIIKCFIKDHPNFYDSYTRTYIERDVRQIINIGNEVALEIKKHATPSIHDISAFKIFSKSEKTGDGCEICLTSEIQPLAPNVTALSIWNI
ncbi:hypothetical protein AGMMS50239_13340 [Bacteroidia bacterium]|nr:hypothetical protein AGMMS50239_13340 [Bacteroidia bacterium]